MCTINWKRIISMMLCIALLAGNLPAVSAAETSGTCGNNLSWTLDGSGTLTVTGTGDMYSYYGPYSSSAKAPWFDNKSQIKRVQIEAGVTYVGNNAFNQCTNLTQVSLPEGISVGEFAFYDTGLTSLVLPERAVIAGRNAFGSNPLVSVTIPGSVTLYDYSFQNCKQLTQLNLGDGLAVLPNGAFKGCDALQNVTIPATVTLLETIVFDGCTQLETVTFTGNMPTFEGNVFRDATLTAYYPANNQTWNAEPTDHGGTVTWIATCGAHDFEGREADYTWSADNSTCTAVLTCGNAGCQVAQTQTVSSDYQVTGEPTCIAGGTGTYTAVFAAPFTTQTKQVSGTTLGEHNVVNGICAVCRQYGTCGDNLIWILDKEGILTISGTGPMWNYGYQNYAPWHARYDEVKTIIIKDGVTGIGKAAFYECTVATTVDIPESVTSIGSNAFSYCFSLTSIDIPEGVTSIDGSTFTSCYSLTSIDIPDGVTSIGRSAFNGCSGLTNIDIPDGVTSIEEETFRGCTGLTSIDIPDGVTSIGEYAFDGCSGLTNVNIPDGVTSIDDYVFHECGSLTSITVPCNVSSIGVGAFAYCTGLTSVAIPGKVTSIGDNAFLYCNALIDVYYEKTTSEWIQLSNRPKGQNLRIHYSCTDSANHWKTETVAPTCGKQGHSYEICSCNSPYERNWQDLSATGNHIYDQQKPEEQYLVTAATCTEKAVYHYSCACGAEGSETFEYGDVKPHTYESKVTPPTCTEGGYTTHTCAACDDTYTDTETAALGHDWKGTGCTRCDESRENPFVDVPENSFFIAPVLWAVEKGITNGVDATHFGPNANCVRAAVVTFLWRAAGEPEPTSTNNPFTDVKETDYFYKAVLWAVEKGITNGLTATTFGPTVECNRAQVVTFLWRAMDKPKVNTTEHPFTDVAEDQFYFLPMLWAVEKGITNGLTAITFGPGNVCNRAQVVTFLYRTYNK